MSIKLMSAIFETEFRDLQDAEGNITKASTAKLVCLALADHANDEGEGAYPGLTKMERKTALSRQGIINVYDALKHNGIIYLEGESRLGTNNYSINKNAFPHATDGSQPTLLVNPLDSGSQPTLPEVVNRVDLNHTLTIKEPSLVDASLASQAPGKWKKLTEKTQQDRRDLLKTAEKIEAELGVKPDLKDNKWKRTVRAVMEFEKNGQQVADFAKWLKSGTEYNRPKTFQMAKDPTLIISNWPQAFQKRTDETRGKYETDDSNTPMSW